MLCSTFLSTTPMETSINIIEEFSSIFDVSDQSNPDNSIDNCCEFCCSFCGNLLNDDELIESSFNSNQVPLFDIDQFQEEEEEEDDHKQKKVVRFDDEINRRFSSTPKKNIKEWNLTDKFSDVQKQFGEYGNSATFQHISNFVENQNSMYSHNKMEENQRLFVGLNRGYPVRKYTNPVKKMKESKQNKTSARNKFVRDLVQEVVGFAPYEKRVIELLKISRDKRALKLLRKRLGNFQRAKKTRDSLQYYLQLMQTQKRK
ncbi:hypothetical protein SNEBB_005946 [Seison nebaliae]|nr:hypothetical protein SNEBB_005946 [Seison nebaliae]